MNCCSVICEGRDDSDNISVFPSHFHADIILCAICAWSKLLDDIDWNVVGIAKEKFCTLIVFVDEVPHQLMIIVESATIPRIIFFINALMS